MDASSRTMEKASLAVKILWAYIRVLVAIRRNPLPRAVQILREGQKMNRVDPRRVSRAIHRLLRIGERRPRCLLTALVLFRLASREQGNVELVIGLPEAGSTYIAHAWVEIDGRDIGPPPGRGIHEELARYS